MRLHSVTVAVLLGLSGCSQPVPQAVGTTFRAEVLRARETAVGGRNFVKAVRHAAAPVLSPDRASIEDYLTLGRTYQLPDHHAPIRQLGSAAIKPLYEIVVDNRLPPDTRIAALGQLCVLAAGEPQRGPKPPIDRRPLAADAGRAFDAFLHLAQRLPGRVVHLGDVVPLDRVGDLIAALPTLSNPHQRTVLLTLKELTHVKCAVQTYGFCGHTTAETRAKVEAQQDAARAACVAHFQEWWQTAQHQSYAEWAAAGLQTRLADDYATHKRWYEDQDDASRERWIRTQTVTPFRFGPTVFTQLVEAFEQAEPWWQVYLLRLIAQTRHPDADAFLLQQLASPDANIRHAAAGGLSRARGPEFRQALRAALRDVDSEVRSAAAVSLCSVDPRVSFEAIIRVLTNEDPAGRADRYHSDACDALLAQPDALPLLRAFVSRHDNPLSAAIARRLERDALQAPSAVEEPDAGVIRLLTSRTPEDQLLGLKRMRIEERAQLLPYAVGALGVHHARSEAVTTLRELGIPDLTLARAEELAVRKGLRGALTWYCYTKFGHDARPLLERIALGAFDQAPTYPDHALLRVLAREDAPGFEARVLDKLAEISKLPKAERELSGWIRALEFFESEATRQTVGRYLNHDSPWIRSASLHVIAARRLTQHLPSVRKLVGEGDRRGEVTLALLTCGDVRGWDALQQTAEHASSSQLVGMVLNRRLGIALRSIRDQVRTKIHAQLREELHREELRHPYIRVLVVALAHEIEQIDAAALRAVLEHPGVHSVTRQYAATALASLGDHAAIPTLEQLVRGWFASTDHIESQYRQPRALVPILSPISADPPWPRFDGSLDPSVALRELGAHQPLVDELLARFDHETARDEQFRCLAGLIGAGWDQQLASTASPAQRDALREQQFSLWILGRSGLPTDRQARHELIDFAKQHWAWPAIARLCETGDKLGLRMALKNPLDAVEVRAYLPDAPRVGYGGQGLLFNQIEDGTIMQDWLQRNIAALVWVPSERAFRLP